MKGQWQKGFTQIFMALMVEVILNCLGLDQLADYGEYVFHLETIKKNQIVIIINTLKINCV